MAREGQFDAYLMDNRLPDISGLELCEPIRAFDSDTPIVFYSGDGTQSNKDKAFLAGAQDYIVKPASCEDGLCLIKAITDRIMRHVAFLPQN